MTKALKYRIYPNKKQEQKLLSDIELCRCLYNVALEQRIISYKQSRKSISCYDQINQLPELKESFPEYKSVHSQTQQDVLRKLDKSFKAFFGRIKKGEKAGFPHFKGRDFYNPICYPQSGFKIKGNKLHLSKIGDIKIKLHRPIKGTIKTCLIIKEGNQWYACFSSEIENKEIKNRPIKTAIGIDLGLASFATLSNGEKIDNPRWFRESEEKLVKIHHKIKNQRKDFSHKLSRRLVNEYDLIAYEDLPVKNMIKNRYLAKSISDVSWNGFCQMLRYKSAERGAYALPVSPRNTSQICSNCGEIVEKALWIRRHKCDKCGLNIDRDENASLNILRLGIEEYRRNYGNQRLGSLLNGVDYEPRSPFSLGNG